jgi:hypothetical protein
MGIGAAGSRKIEREGAALIIVLTFVVLLTGLVVAYFSRTTVDRQLANSSFASTAADVLARSALDVVVGDLRQEIANGGMPPAAANIVPQRSGNTATVPNLIRRSVRADALAAPAVPSRASAVNSASDPSLNNRTVSAARWNKHYLIPRRPPVAPQNAATIYTDPVATFVAPDWVLVSDIGPAVLASPTTSVIGRYAYAVYDEGGLLDVNVAGFPSANSNDPAYLATIGKKGVLAFADLTATGLSFSAIDNIIGWRNYLSAQPAGGYKTFSFPANPAAFISYFVDPARDLATVATPAAYPLTGAPPPVDQSFTSRGQLLEVRRTLSADQDAMQYLGTFSRGMNRSTWSNSASVLAGRFPLARFDLFANPPANAAAAADIQTYFGLAYVPAAGPTAEHWRYYGTGGAALQHSIPPIAGLNQTPDLFPLLQYALPTATTDELLSIGASLIDQRDGNNDTTWIEYAGPNPAAPPLKAFGVDVNASLEAGAPARPATVMVLNRAFRNTGELGYAYRNGATSLDFRSASTDAPLLDLFTYNTVASRPGLLSLNTQNAGALAAIIKGAFPTETSAAGISGPAATTAAASIVAATAAQPAVGRADIARLAGAVTNAPFAADEERNETVARALSELTETRTWNLMIDVVAQSGRYPATATTPADLPKFMVKSERRYWLHIAIDRFTGKVIEQQLEAVYE